MPDLAFVSVVAIVLLALVFDFTNGFHDAANSIATVVSTRVLTPRMAVVWAALFNFVAFLVFQTHVANTMGIIAALLVGSGYLQLKENGDLPVPLWVVLAAHAAIALGTLSGGWRIVHTMGSKITKLQPVGGFAAETAGAISLFTATNLGIPVSTTHTITGAIMGVGSIQRLSAVRWGVARRIVWAWVLTIPMSALISAVTWWIIS